jgi:hypothetical protein
MTRAYPITIAQSRYSGTYEGAESVAFHLDPHNIPAEAFGDDSTCMAWWFDHGEGSGKGQRPRRHARTSSESRNLSRSPETRATAGLS